MGRPREFDTDAAIEGAMTIFWRQGYKATNLPDLLEAMGLTRGSFYKAFGDKESVYLHALDHYDRVAISRGVAMLDGCQMETASDCLSQLFASAKDARQGCFLCNAIVELAPTHPEVASKAVAMTGRLRAAIQSVLERHGVDRQAEETADLVLHLYFGHQALGKAQASQDSWRHHLALLLGEGAA
ncbi:TetR/AcrR family transcriptional regulator [Roseovarius sp. 2305UL8-3]|uniref:TetR/AcrR family transcriptional regulator n=1 Tax=Roseovarius conchicola TaxID=3121636 RepID=UPI003527EBF6